MQSISTGDFESLPTMLDNIFHIALYSALSTQEQCNSKMINGSGQASISKSNRFGITNSFLFLIRITNGFRTNNLMKQLRPLMHSNAAQWRKRIHTTFRAPLYQRLKSSFWLVSVFQICICINHWQLDRENQRMAVTIELEYKSRQKFLPDNGYRRQLK